MLYNGTVSGRVRHASGGIGIDPQTCKKQCFPAFTQQASGLYFSNGLGNVDVRRWIECGGDRRVREVSAEFVANLSRRPAPAIQPCGTPASRQASRGLTEAFDGNSRTSS